MMASNPVSLPTPAWALSSKETLVIPPHLKPGDALAIVAPGFLVTPGQIAHFLPLAEAAGLQVRLGQHLYAEWGPFAGTDEQRLADLQWALDDPQTKAVFFGRGGYGLSRLLHRIDWRHFATRPKWLAGFSDLTLLLNQVVGMGTACLHSPVAISARKPEIIPYIEKTLGLLMGQPWQLDFAAEEGSVSQLDVTGPLIGGNLSLLASAVGTAAWPQLKGAILIIEEVGEAWYHVDRLFWHLRRAGVLDELKAVVIGQMTEMRPTRIDFPLSLPEIVQQALAGLNVPVVLGLPAGHDDEVNEPLPLGLPVRLRVENGLVRMEMVEPRS